MWVRIEESIAEVDRALENSAIPPRTKLNELVMNNTP